MSGSSSSRSEAAGHLNIKTEESGHDTMLTNKRSLPVTEDEPSESEVGVKKSRPSKSRRANARRRAKPHDYPDDHYTDEEEEYLEWHYKDEDDVTGEVGRLAQEEAQWELENGGNEDDSNTSDEDYVESDLDEEQAQEDEQSDSDQRESSEPQEFFSEETEVFSLAVLAASRALEEGESDVRARLANALLDIGEDATLFLEFFKLCLQSADRILNDDSNDHRGELSDEERVPVTRIALIWASRSLDIDINRVGDKCLNMVNESRLFKVFIDMCHFEAVWLYRNREAIFASAADEEGSEEGSEVPSEEVQQTSSGAVE